MLMVLLLRMVQKHMNYTPAPVHATTAPADLYDACDYFGAFMAFSAVAVYQKQEQVRQASAQAHLQEVGIIIVPGVIPPPQVVSGFIPSSVPAAVPLLCFRLFHSFSFVPE